MSGVGTFAIPYIPKPSMFPKFVDPRMMIAKKTDLLANMFGGLGPAYGPFGPMYPGMYGADDAGESDTGDAAASEKLPTLYASGFDPKMSYAEEFGPEDPAGLKRGLFGPTGAKTPFGGPFGPKKPFGFADSAASGGSPFARSLADSSSLKTEKAGYLDSLFKSESSTDVSPTDEPPKMPVTLGDNGTQVKDLTKRMIADDSTVPKEYLPGMYGPMGPMYGPPIGVFGPDAFMSKKSMFLDTLFKNLATSTVAPVTDTPDAIPKSTIVPPGFWVPEAIAPGPGAYNAKVATFLDKLFDSLKLNASGTTGDSTVTEEPISAGFPGARSLPADYSPYLNEMARSLPDPEAVIIAKDQIVSSIISELVVLKDDMVSTFNDLVAFQKNISTPTPGGKPFKPFPSPYWPPPSSSAFELGSMPYKRRMIILDQVFDMLTELQSNVTEAVNEAVKASFEEAAEPEPIATTVKPDMTTLNISVLDAIQAKLSELSTISTTKVASKSSRALPESPASFWVAYPGGPTARRNSNEEDENFNAAGKDPRAVKMQMHQGYQSLPPGSIESIQAGGGSVPGHEGGGVKLLVRRWDLTPSNRF